MKVNPIIQDIFKGEWLLDAHSILSYAPIISKIIAGDEIVFEKSSTALMTVADKTGKRLRANEDGQIEIPPGSIATVNLKGPVVKNGDFCTYGADEIVNALRFANSHKNIKGIFLDTDGPGGAVNAIGPFLHFAKEKMKPVIATVDMAYSLHYWAVCACADVIIADNDVTSGVGSVGVEFSYVDSRPVLEAAGHVFHVIRPPESEHKNQMFDLVREGKYDMIKEEFLSPTAKKFQAGVRAARPNIKEATGVLTGKTFRAEEALAYGMIDSIGGKDAALEQMEILLELRQFKR